ncbi:ribosome hibernation-promoting factor, HPF/YfiA family [Pumilibacter muris]|jgi:putative sigma-54 modulation protein|uniref:ribosome hibernation-promoting factor, HPF/YfiA family n=1 Tax=Pumilibacter muris TaxID=2941510 RepID=UPI002040E08B|nr:ribosome-associated translation inhibitor RaiA [Pumilibacter muris]
MRIEFLTKTYTPSEKLKDVITKKVQRLDKFFEDDTKVKILLKKANDVETLELTIVLDSAVMRAEVSSGNMYENIDIALPKLEKQIIKHRSKLIAKSKKVRSKELDAAYVPAAEKEETHGVVRSKSYELTPMTVDDAIEELELVGHSFYVFSNKSTKKVNVLYKRHDGDYGLIEALP